MNNYHNRSVKKAVVPGVLLFLLAVNSLFAAEGAATRRFGIFIGANNGGRDRVMLRYAVSDAVSLSRIFGSMGGIADNDSVLLVEPTIAEINRQIDIMGKLSSQARSNSQRTELVFYYSGHSDEDGILLNKDRYGYRELRERINKVQADMKIVILDSCSSGAITRVKGGVKAQPFLFDSSVSAEGFAFLTSSSENETSQESDSIGSSYFTYSLLAGLRGAADSVGDGRVTLNELYRYAYAETLAKTETSAFGTQHPSYDIQISGSGDVVLTDIKEISSSLFFTEGLTGRISIRNGSDFLIAELTKAGGKPLEFGLEPGLYRIILQQGNNFYRAEIKLPEKRRATLDMKSFSTVVAFSGDRSRGNQGQGGDDSDADVPVYPVSLQLLPVPGFDLFGHHGWEQITNNFLFGLFAGRGCNIKGLGLSSLGLVNTGFVRGAQVSGLFNYTRLDVRGVQIAGLFNMASSLRGLQMGLVNINEGGCGCMAGLVNKSESENMFPLGLVNIIKNGIIHFGVYYDDMQFVNASFRSGSKYFYSFVSFGLGTNYSYSRLDTEKEGRNIPIGFRTGLGFECPVKNFFIDVDISGGCIFVTGNEDNGYENKLANYTVPSGQVRLIGGYKFFEQLGVFAGLTYSIYRLPLIPDKKANDYYVKSGSYYSYKWGFVAGVQF